MEVGSDGTTHRYNTNDARNGARLSLAGESGQMTRRGRRVHGGEGRSTRPKFSWGPSCAALLLMCGSMLNCGDAGERAATEALRSLELGKVTGTRGSMEAIARALQAYALDHSGYPVDGTFDEAVQRLFPAHLRAPIRADAWGHPFTYRSDGASFTLASPGPDERPGTDDDIVMIDGRFVEPADRGNP